ncbi:hypothetical protein AeMF1_007290 [Aphanomyces euteiches]|nr:hypothetical protein AeMF1_007290 [Aphanomyces euteiches]KAH9194137.1 hypothetical protein AeNC1_003891 [Aphanomyces euteiches]
MKGSPQEMGAIDGQDERKNYYELNRERILAQQKAYRERKRLRLLQATDGILIEPKRRHPRVKHIKLEQSVKNDENSGNKGQDAADSAIEMSPHNCLEAWKLAFESSHVVSMFPIK